MRNPGRQKLSQGRQQLCGGIVPVPDSIKLATLTYLYKELKRLKISLANAEMRPNITTEELQNIENKIFIVDYLIGITLKEE